MKSVESRCDIHCKANEILKSLRLCKQEKYDVSCIDGFQDFVCFCNGFYIGFQRKMLNTGITPNTLPKIKDNIICDICEKKFQHKYELITHKRLKPYSCQFCNQTFHCIVNLKSTNKYMNIRKTTPVKYA